LGLAQNQFSMENAPLFYSEGELLNVKGKVTKIVNSLGLVTYRLVCGNRAGFDFGRTKQGLLAVRKKGKLLGRPSGKSKLDQFKLELEALLGPNENIAAISRISFPFLFCTGIMPGNSLVQNYDKINILS
jgi:hypothetical protein